MEPKAPEVGFEMAHIATVELGSGQAARPVASNSNPSHMQNKIKKVAVLGAGTMGARIAAHVANAGFPCVLLDIVPPGTDPTADKATKNKIVAAGFEAAKKSKPAAFTEAGNASLITIGNFDDDLKLISGCDWIIE